MSRAGIPESVVTGFNGTRVVVVASSWHTKIMDGLIAGACRIIENSGITPEIHRVPGTFELPIAAKAAALSGADVVVALGVVIRGSTPHFDYVCSAATDGLTRVALDTGVPMGFGVLTCDDEAQALDRAGLPGSSEDKGAEAASAAMNTWTVLRAIHGE
jgi:6,7-dimethyl-8-ribityllumazine synthase